ncbi:MAG: hypothetical protein QM731_05615 [Chitinophagaceae bacterium]
MKRIPKDLPPVYFVGTYGNLTFYFWKGKYCVRTKSSLTGKRVKTSKEFSITMQYAERLGHASRIASKVYRQLPDGWKLHYLYRKMTGVGAQLLKERACTEEDVEIVLWQYLASIGFKAQEHGIEHPLPVALQQPCRIPVKIPPPPRPLVYYSTPGSLVRRGKRKVKNVRMCRLVNVQMRE